MLLTIGVAGLGVWLLQVVPPAPDWAESLLRILALALPFLQTGLTELGKRLGLEELLGLDSSVYLARLVTVVLFLTVGAGHLPGEWPVAPTVPDPFAGLNWLIAVVGVAGVKLGYIYLGGTSWYDRYFGPKAAAATRE